MKESSGAAGRWVITSIIAVIAAIATAVCYMMMRRGTPGMHFAFYIVLAGSVLIVLHLALWSLSAHERCGRVARAVWRYCLICLAVGLVAFISLEVVIINGARSDDAAADCVIILGAGLNGEIPHPVLASRLDAAVEYLKDYSDIPVIVSGGQGPGEAITEAEAMLRYLKARGIDESRIWKEDKSTSTFENLSYSRELMDQLGLDAGNIKVAVVTNEFHLFRARYIAGRAGLDAVGVAAETPGAGLRAVYYCREAFALAYALVFGG